MVNNYALHYLTFNRLIFLDYRYCMLTLLVSIVLTFNPRCKYSIDMCLVDQKNNDGQETGKITNLSLLPRNVRDGGRFLVARESHVTVNTVIITPIILF